MSASSKNRVSIFGDERLAPGDLVYNVMLENIQYKLVRKDTQAARYSRMTKGQFKAIKAAYKAAKRQEQAIEESNENLEQLTEAWRKLGQECDHILPNGKSAWVAGFLMNQCSICGKGDM